MTSVPTPAPQTPISVEIVDETGKLTHDHLSWLTLHITKAVHCLGVTGDVRARILGDEAMAAAHQEYLEVPGTTDVITFDLRDPESGGDYPTLEPGKIPVRSDNVRNMIVLDTDLLICWDEAERQSKERGGTGAAVGGGGEYAVSRELLLYAVHGVLHCLGLDDHDEESFKKMHAVEDAVLTAIGVGPVFGRPEGA